MSWQPETQAAVLAAFPFLREAGPEVLDALWQHGRPAAVPAGAFICLEGNRCPSLPLVLGGTARVYKAGENGREITLYRIERGEACIVTASCILSDAPFPAFAVAETDVAALLIPPDRFVAWTGRSEAWRRYVFSLLARRLADVMEIVGEVTFRRVDARLAGALLAATGDRAAAVRTTHEALAVDLGTSREVVSRVLKAFEARGLVALARGAVTVRDVKALRRIATRNEPGD
jgi:CRP/FNR family transcriptional regulator